MMLVIPMPIQEDANESLIKELLKADLHLSGKARFESRMPPGADSHGIRTDHIIRDGDDLYLVEVQNLASENSIAKLALLKQLLRDDTANINYVLAAKNIPKTIWNLAGRLHVAVVQLPLNIPVNIIDDEGRITTQNAWKVVTAILSNELTSIKGISRRAGISYGWAHRITNRLISRGIAEKLNDQVRMANLEKLLEAAALERPMAAMSMGAVRTGYSTSQDAASGLSNLLDKSKIGFAFTGFTAASIYTGSAIRHDAVYLYLKNEENLLLLKSDEVRSLRGIKAYLYKPDRDVTRESQRIGDVRVVSKEQALLDMAGFGRSGGVLAMEMARNYGTINDTG
jgi:hypothetical protein